MSTNKILSCDSYYIVDVIMYRKFGDCSISIKKSYHNLNFINIWLEKTLFWRMVLIQVQQFRTGTQCGLEISHQFEKRIKGKSKKILGANSYRKQGWKYVHITHPAERRCGDVVTMSLWTSQRRQRYVSNETSNDFLVEYCQEIFVLHLHDILLERHDDVWRGLNAPSVRLHNNSNKSQM